MKTRAGFTLIELLVVIAIIGILSAVGIVNLPRDKFQVREVSRIISADILRARSEAIRLNTTVDITFDVANDSYTIAYLDEDTDPPEEVIILERRLSSEFPLATLSSTTFAGDKVAFDVRGLPSPIMGGTVNLISQGQSSYALNVVMAAQGRVRVEKVSP